MWNDVRGIVSSVSAGLRRGYRDLAFTDVAFRLVAFAALSPFAALLLRWAMSRVDRGALADVDIARFFITTRAGFFALVAVSTVVVAITALEAASLLAIALSQERGLRLAPGKALLFAGRRAGHVLALAAHMVLRVLLLLVPALAAGGLVYWALLREHDINFYLTDKPPAFWLAACLVGVIVAVLVTLLARAVARWALALPLVLFEGVPPRRALGASAERVRGRHGLVLAGLGAWLAFALGIHVLAAALVEALGRAVAPSMVNHLGLLLAFVTGLLILAGLLALAIAVLNAALFALVLLEFYRRLGHPKPGEVPGAVPASGSAPPRITGRAVAATAALAVLAGLGVTLFALLVTRATHDVVVIAHRGSCKVAPENSLAAFRLAIEEGADYIELDVQESADGEVVVAHDLDLMKVGGSPLKIFETTAEELRTVPIGRLADPAYADERLPLLSEVLDLCKGKIRVIIELKSYGHAQRLEERVAAIVEAAGMERDCIYMSLDHRMAARMKKLRPDSRVGILVAKAIGDVLTIEADFVAVEARMATPRFVRRAHRAGRQVYVWTVNDPGWMFATMSRGVDGLITDVPAVARQAVERRAAMTDAQRFLVALLIRLGARTEALAAEDALRP